jgi:hypothetical protein
MELRAFLRLVPSETLPGVKMRHGLIWCVMAVAAVVPAVGGTISVNLGSASDFALLGSTITETGDGSIIDGNVGATTTITSNGAWVVIGTVYPAPGGPSSTAGKAYGDFESAYNTAIGLSSSQPGLGSLGMTQTFIGNNVYTFTDNISTTTGTALTFDAQNNPNEVFVIQVDGNFTVNGILTFDLINGAQANNIFWVVEDAAAISVGSSPPQTFDGSILAGTSFTMSAASGESGALAGTIDGCVFSETANTLSGVTNVDGCAGGGLPGGGPDSGPPGATPEPGTLATLTCGLLAMAFLLFRTSRAIPSGRTATVFGRLSLCPRLRV